MKIPNKFRWLLLACAVLSGCIKDFNPPCDEVPDEDETIFTEGYSLDFVVTLDALGGDGLSLPYDDYVDTEKFRVFFFTDDEDPTLEEDEKNVFLFESRTRFIKMLPGTSGPSSAWRVSVPLFSYGNGAAAEWNWEKIRRFLRTHPFKIALLVNRPESEWSMRIIGKTTPNGNSWADNPDDVIVPGAWYDNSAPHWEAENTFFGKADPNVVVTDGKLDPAIKAEYKGSWKTLLDLHHVQYDPIYFGKSFVVNPPNDQLIDNVTDPNDPAYNGGLGLYYHNTYPIYDFVGKKGDDGRLMMGSTSSWVSWSGYDGELATNPNITGNSEPAASDTNRDPYGWTFRRTIHPSQDYPIPMYGIQRFEPIEEWDWGTPVLLDKDIFLLRSVVRLDLYVPADMTVNFLTLFYSNVFSRCEPMDVWTPTDILWDRYVTGKDNRLDTSYEMKQILNYGPITRQAENTDFPNDSKDEEGSVRRYQQRMCWLYGIWMEKAGWKWNNFNVNPKDANHKGKVEFDQTTEDLFFPHLFNPCVQRNTAVYCPVGAPAATAVNGNTVRDPAWNDYINGNTVEVTSDVPGYRRFAIYTGERNINDPSTFTNVGHNGSGRPTVAYFMIGIKDGNNESSYSIPLVNYGGGTDNSPDKSLGKYDGNPVVKGTYASDNKPGNNMSSFEQSVMNNPAAGASKLPYPLIRNHVYQFFITRNGTRSGAPEIGVTSDVRRSEYVVRERPEARPEVAPDPAPEE